MGCLRSGLVSNICHVVWCYISRSNLTRKKQLTNEPRNEIAVCVHIYIYTPGSVSFYIFPLTGRTMEVERACFVEQADTKTAFLRQHINLVKIIGVIFILLSAFIIPSVVLMTTVCFPNNTYSSEIDVEANQTACMYVKQFALSREYASNGMQSR